MKTLKTAVIALSVLALSSAALAHGRAYGHRHYRHDTRRVLVMQPRYEARYEPRCESTQRIVYLPAKVVVRQPLVAVQPGLQVRLAFKF